MPLILKPLTLDELRAAWPDLQNTLKAPHPFVLPEWLNAWWGSFEGGEELFLRAVICDDEIIGIAPLRIGKNIARFIGSADVCDYLDFMIKPETERDFYSVVLDGLTMVGVKVLELESLRPDSSVIKHLVPLALLKGNSVQVVDTDVTLEMELPVTWQGYLAALTNHQRHETGRKLRRLEESGNIQFDIKPLENMEDDLATLIRLLRISRTDKAMFMTEKMEEFFKRLAGAMLRTGLLRFGHLRLRDTIVASIMCFDYNGTRYLYNSGYDPEFSSLSVGLLSKVLSIKDAIEQKMIKYDYLKGAEVYKYHLGGKEMPISTARIELAK